MATVEYDRAVAIALVERCWLWSLWMRNGSRPPFPADCERVIWLEGFMIGFCVADERRRMHEASKTLPKFMDEKDSYLPPSEWYDPSHLVSDLRKLGAIE